MHSLYVWNIEYVIPSVSYMTFVNDVCIKIGIYFFRIRIYIYTDFQQNKFFHLQLLRGNYFHPFIK